MLTLLTATGARPEAWAICEALMARQDYEGRVRWVVVDDGPEPQPVTFSRPEWDVEVLRPEPFWVPGQNSQSRNLMAGLAVISPDEQVVIIEDDDYYAPDWLAVVAEKLQTYEMVGLNRAKYYNLKMKKYRQMGNVEHSSLCSTAMRGGALKIFRAVCEPRHKFIDMALWRDVENSKYLFDGQNVIGLKGLPGRKGIGCGHTIDFKGKPDVDGMVLRQWLGEGIKFYEL